MSDGLPDDILRRFEERRLIRERRRALALAEFDQQAEEDRIALKVLKEIYESAGERRSAPLPVSAHAVRVSDTPATAAAIQESTEKLPVKDLVLAIVRSAYPKGLKASQIAGLAAVRHKVTINPNTLSVTLARHKEPGTIRLVGKEWFYVKRSDASASGAFARQVSQAEAAE